MLNVSTPKHYTVSILLTLQLLGYSHIAGQVKSEVET